MRIDRNLPQASEHRKFYLKKFRSAFFTISVHTLNFFSAWILRLNGGIRGGKFRFWQLHRKNYPPPDFMVLFDLLYDKVRPGKW